MTLKSLPEKERPRERMQDLGVGALSSAELIAIILGHGAQGKSALEMAGEILQHFGSIEKIAEATFEELQQIKGLGFAKAAKLKAAVGLSERAKGHSKRRTRISAPSHAYQLVREQLEREKRELLITILLDIKGYAISRPVVSMGTLSETLVHPREVFYPAIRHKASSIVLAHNHPSGDPTPSKQDLDLTHILIEAGKIMGIPVYDHIIVGDNSYVSLREAGVFSS